MSAAGTAWADVIIGTGHPGGIPGTAGTLIETMLTCSAPLPLPAWRLLVQCRDRRAESQR